MVGSTSVSYAISFLLQGATFSGSFGLCEALDLGVEGLEHTKKGVRVGGG